MGVFDFINKFYKFKIMYICFCFRILKVVKEKWVVNFGGGLFFFLYWFEMGSKGYEFVCLNRDSLEEKVEFISVFVMIVNGFFNVEVMEII